MISVGVRPPQLEALAVSVITVVTSGLPTLVAVKFPGEIGGADTLRCLIRGLFHKYFAQVFRRLCAELFLVGAAAAVFADEWLTFVVSAKINVKGYYYFAALSPGTCLSVSPQCRHNKSRACPFSVRHVAGHQESKEYK